MEGRMTPFPVAGNPRIRGEIWKGERMKSFPQAGYQNADSFVSQHTKYLPFNPQRLRFYPKKLLHQHADKYPRIGLVHCQNLVNAAVLAFVLVFCQISRFFPHVPKLWQEVPSDPSWCNVIQKLLLQPAVLLETAGIFFIRLNPSEIFKIFASLDSRTFDFF